MKPTMQAHRAAAIFPIMQEDELQRLADDIKQNGQREKIVVTKDGQILDGRNRAAACALAGIAVEQEEWDGKPGDEFEFVFSRNITRRHLNESQRALAAALAAPMVKDKGIHLGGMKVVNLPPDRRAKTAEILGALFGVSEKTVRYAIAISNSPVLREAVQSGRFSVSAVFRLAKLTPALQRQRLGEWAEGKVRTPAAAAESADSPSVPYLVVDLNASGLDPARPNLTCDATVVIKADSSQIGAAVALLAKWKVPITDVRCEHGAFEPGAVRLIGGRLPKTADESALRNGLGAPQAVVAEDPVGTSPEYPLESVLAAKANDTVEHDPDGSVLQSASPVGNNTLFISRSGRTWELGEDVACLRYELDLKLGEAEVFLEDGEGLDASQILDILRTEWKAIPKSARTVDNLRRVIQKAVAKGKAPESAAPAGSTALAVGPALLPNKKQTQAAPRPVASVDGLDIEITGAADSKDHHADKGELVGESLPPMGPEVPELGSVTLAILETATAGLAVEESMVVKPPRPAETRDELQARVVTYLATLQDRDWLPASEIHPVIRPLMDVVEFDYLLQDWGYSSVIEMNKFGKAYEYRANEPGEPEGIEEPIVAPTDEKSVAAVETCRSEQPAQIQTNRTRGPAMPRKPVKEQRCTEDEKAPAESTVIKWEGDVDDDDDSPF
jgi:hypothetical protein